MKMSRLHMDTRDKLAVVCPLCMRRKTSDCFCRASVLCLRLAVLDTRSWWWTMTAAMGLVAVVEEAAARNPHIRLLVRKGGAWACRGNTSWLAAYRCKHSGVMDADLQHPPELLLRLLSEVLKGNDVCAGQPLCRARENYRLNPVRRLLSTVAVWTTLPLQSGGAACAGPYVRLFSCSADGAWEKRDVSAGRLQAAAGDSCSRVCSLRVRGSICIWKAKGWRQQS